jgi:hypothetical protein
MNKQTSNRTNKQTNKQTKIPSSGTIEFQSYFKFWCYSSSIKSWCWYLSRSSVLQRQLLGQLLPQWVVAVWVCRLSSGSGGQLLICQPAPCCQQVVMVCWFFNFALSFDFRCCSLAEEMSFVDLYLPCFRQWLITHLLSALLPFQPLFTESYCRNQLLAPPPFSSALTAPRPLCCVLVFSSLFIVQLFCFVLFYGRGQCA